MGVFKSHRILNSFEESETINLEITTKRKSTCSNPKASVGLLTSSATQQGQRQSPFGISLRGGSKQNVW